ncbi:MAG TPA: DUF2892 domain-containing protein [Burkholderiales bacterium]|nr:DUF2892 domain-containing protein [Burkholderiales bacterium]
MKANVGGIDRLLRIVVGVVPLLTAAFGYCPLYVPFGFTTCPLEKKPF